MKTKENMSEYYATYHSPLGTLVLKEQNGALTNIFYEGDMPAFIPLAYSAFLQNVATQLDEYFAGNRKVFDIPLAPKGGEFFQKVWKIMQEQVTFGKKITYSELATLADSPKACRAVGMANNKNPIPIIIPCHRVVGKNGSLVGFRWGMDAKVKLLELERNEK